MIIDALSPMDQLEAKYPIGHPVRENDRIGKVVGYEIGSDRSFVIIEFDNGNRKKVRVS